MCISDSYLYTLLTLYRLFLWTEGNTVVFKQEIIIMEVNILFCFVFEDIC